MESNLSPEEHDELMQYLVSEGAAIFSGMSEDGDPIYKFDMDVLEEVMPELHQALVDDMDKTMVDLYQKGLIEVSYDEELNAQISVSEEGKILLEQAGFDFSNLEEVEDSEDY